MEKAICKIFLHHFFTLDRHVLQNGVFCILEKAVCKINWSHFGYNVVCRTVCTAFLKNVVSLFSYRILKCEILTPDCGHNRMRLLWMDWADLCCICRAIDLILCTYVPLGEMECTDQISVRSDSSLGHQGAKTENAKSAITPELMAGSSPNFYHRYSS
jgi:hypothetical protein